MSYPIEFYTIYCDAAKERKGRKALYFATKMEVTGKDKEGGGDW